jgi:holin-like protein
MPARPVGGVRVRRGLDLWRRLVGQGLLLWLLYTAGGHLAQATGLPLPANLVGLLLLLVLLATGVVRPDELREVAAVVGRHLSFFFVPFLVGLLAWTTLVATSGTILALSLLGSAVVGLATAGLAAQHLTKRMP